jgi:hypothetical protein
MKKMNFAQMEVINGGTTEVGYGDFNPAGVDGLSASAGARDCLIACGGALLTGTGGLILTAATGGAGIGWAIAFNWATWTGAAYSCGRASGKF